MDTISDFITAEDILEFTASNFGMTAGGPVALQTVADYATANSGTADEYFIYDTDGANAGTVYWDPTGGAGSDAIALANLQGTPGLLTSNFELV